MGKMKKFILLFVLGLSTIGFLAVPTYAKESIKAEYESKNKIKVTIPKEEQSDTVYIKVEDFITEFTNSEYLYPGLLETGQMDIINESKYNYEITDITFYGEAKKFQKTLNDMCFELGLSNGYYKTGVLNISDDEWFSKNEAYYNLDSHIDYDILQQMFGVNTKTDQLKKYKTNKTVGQETNSKMIDYANKLLWNKGIRISLDIESHPIDLLETGNSAQDFFDKEPAKKVLENILGKEVKSHENEEIQLGYKIDENYFVNAFQGSQIALDFEIEMKRVVDEVVDPEGPGGEKEKPGGIEEQTETEEDETGNVLGEGEDFPKEVGKTVQKQTGLALGDNTKRVAYIIFLIISSSSIIYNKAKLKRK